MKLSLPIFAVSFGASVIFFFLLDLSFSEGWMTFPGLTGNLYGHRTSHRCGCSCGLKNRIQTRLLGGKTTGINEFPWVAALLYKGHYFCSGTLINERYILTAAHCIRGVNVTKMKALLGEHVRSFPIETKIQYYDVIYSIYHHLFDGDTFNNDIALVKVAKKVPFKWYTRPACLPSPNMDYVGELSTVTGWGRAGEDGDISDSLQKIVVPVFSNEVCRTRLRFEPHEITDNMICAGYASGRRDSCHGDSGGGLLWEGRDKKIDVIGVVSWGHGCGRRNLPGIYTRVSEYLSWIAYHTRDTCFCARRHATG